LAKIESDLASRTEPSSGRPPEPTCREDPPRAKAAAFGAQQEWLNRQYAKLRSMDSGPGLPMPGCKRPTSCDAKSRPHYMYPPKGAGLRGFCALML